MKMHIPRFVWFQTLKKPRVSWKADPNALYFLLMEDQDIDGLPVKFNHWTVTNIPGKKCCGQFLGYEFWVEREYSNLKVK